MPSWWPWRRSSGSGRTDRVAEVLTVEQMVPQVGQGALAVECRARRRRGARPAGARSSAPLDRSFVELERAFLAALGGGCDLPVGAHAHLDPTASSSCTRFLAGPTGVWHDRAPRRPAARSRLGDGRWPGRRPPPRWLGMTGDGHRHGARPSSCCSLIRNACVNDGTPESGHEVRSADVLQTYLEGAGLDVEVFEPTPGPPLGRGPHRGQRSHRRRRCCLMGHTDVVPVSPAGLAARPVRRRAGRRRDLGPGRHRHAEPHGVDGGRHQAPRPPGLAAAGHARLPRRGRRGGRRRPRGRLARAARARRRRLRLRDHRVAAGGRSTGRPAAEGGA